VGVNILGLANVVIVQLINILVVQHQVKLKMNNFARRLEKQQHLVLEVDYDQVKVVLLRLPYDHHYVVGNLVHHQFPIVQLQVYVPLQ
jgi:hypothetical protein